MSHKLADMTPTRRWFEYVIRFLVFYSIICYLLELEFSEDGHSTGFWLWNERFCAAVFTLEYIIRWMISDDKKHYPFKLLSVIDLIAVVPFYIGFFVPPETLGVIRSLRILRLLKLVRYSPALVLVLHSFRKVKNELGVLSYIILMLVLLSSVLIYQFEKDAQPDKFERPSDAIWWSFVTVATVGYGDLAPVTPGGRLIAILTMICGIGIFGVFVSLVGSAFIVVMKEEHQIQDSTSQHNEEKK